MLQLTYISTVRPEAERALADIERQAQRNNSAHDLSGVLLFDGHRFLQVLEGPEDAVRAMFERIKRDPRHYALVTLSEKAITARSFGAWSMLSRNLSGRGVSLGEAVEPHLGKADKSVHALLSSFARLRDKKAA